MITKLKNNFKKLNNFNKFLKLEKIGNKIYFNTNNTKKIYKFNNYTFGYSYFIKLYNFNVVFIKFIIIDKKNKEYVNLIKYYNVSDFNLLFLN